MTTGQIIWLGGYLVYLFLIYTPAIARYRRQKVAASRSRVVDMALDLLTFLVWQILPLVYIFSSWLDFADYSLPPWAVWLGAAFFLLALGVLWAAYRSLGKSWSPRIDVLAAQKLVTTGIYRRIRHPIYSGILLWALANPLLLPNWIAGPGMLVVFLPLLALRVPREEHMLSEAFGEPYQEYTYQTGRFWPKLR